MQACEASRGAPRCHPASSELRCARACKYPTFPGLPLSSAAAPHASPSGIEPKQPQNSTTTTEPLLQLSCTHPRPQLLMYCQRDHRLVLHGHVPQLEVHVVPAEDVAPVTAEADVADGRDDLAKERFVALCTSSQHAGNAAANVSTACRNGHNAQHWAPSCTAATWWEDLQRVRSIQTLFSITGAPSALPAARTCAARNALTCTMSLLLVSGHVLADTYLHWRAFTAFTASTQ